MTVTQSTVHELKKLKTQHRDLDQAALRLARTKAPDNDALLLLKKRKLALKDRISYLEGQLTPV